VTVPSEFLVVPRSSFVIDKSFTLDTAQAELWLEEDATEVDCELDIYTATAATISAATMIAITTKMIDFFTLQKIRFFILPGKS
jgi:hypothetical protein